MSGSFTDRLFDQLRGIRDLTERILQRDNDEGPGLDCRHTTVHTIMASPLGEDFDYALSAYPAAAQLDRQDRLILADALERSARELRLGESPADHLTVGEVVSYPRESRDETPTDATTPSS